MERRNLKRRHLLFYLRVFDTATGGLLGHVVDITPEGLMLISENPVPAGSDFELEMDLPAEGGQSKKVRFSARSAWCKEDINPDFFDTGFQMSLEPQNTRIIEDLIERFGFRD